MIEQLDNSLLALAFFSNISGEGVTGLTVTVDAWRVVNNAGTPSATQVLTAQTVTEIGGGVYGRVLASSNVNAEGNYVFVFKTTSSLVRDKQLPALWVVNVAGVEHLDADIADVPDAVWDEPLSGHLTAGSTGAALDESTGSTTVTLGDITSLSFNNLDLVSYGDHHSVALDGSVYELEIPPMATVIGLQATDEDIVFTDDDSDPTSTHGFVLTANSGIQFLALDTYRSDDPLKFLRSTAGANLQYRFFRPA